MILVAFVAMAGPAGAPTAFADAGTDQIVDVKTKVEFDGSASTGAGSLEYSWYYRDGSAYKGNDAKPEHTFTTEGVYEVGLIVKDDNGYFDLDTVQITVKNSYPTADAGSNIVASEDEVVDFDGTASSDLNDDIVSHEWDFGDGSGANAETASNIYETEGIYYSKLKVTDNDGAYDEDTITVTVKNIIPLADGVANGDVDDDVIVYEDDMIAFDASSSSDTPSDMPSLKYAWDFGDGSKGHGPATTYVYTKQGVYSAVLTVTDDNDARSQDTITVNVLNALPTSDAGHDQSVDEGSSLFFDGSGSSDTPSDEPALEYSWDFETDGAYDDAGWHSRNTWWDDGTHDVTLEVEDDDAAANTDTQVVTVNNVAPFPSIYDYTVADYTTVDFGLRIAGEKWHDVDMILYEESTEIGSMYLYREPGSPNDQMDFVYGVQIDRFTHYEAKIIYTPEDDPINGQIEGASPCWLILYLEDGNEFWFQRAFNYNKPDEWTWEIDLSSIVKVDFEAEAYDPGMDTLTFNWDFGDSQPIVSHTYAASGTYPTRITDAATHIYVLPQVYTITLSGDDDDAGHREYCLELTNVPMSVTVDNLAPRAYAAVDRMLAQEDEPFSFSGTHIDLLNGGHTYHWSFDDGSFATGRISGHSYADEGIYIVTLTVTDSLGASGKDYVFVEVTNIDPIAHAGFDQSAVEDSAVSFDASDSWDTPSDLLLLKYAWDYGDGSMGYGEYSGHVYTKTGLYTVSLTVQDNNGAVSTDTLVVEVTNPAPYGLAITAKGTVDENELNFFHATASDTPTDEPLLAYDWDFGDGATGHGMSPAHSYDTPGAYVVEVTVTDDDSGTDSKNTTILTINVKPRAFAGPTHMKVYGPATTLDFEGRGFDTFSDLSTLTYAWNLGGGTYQYTPASSKHLSATGIYDISFRVTDQHSGASATIQIRIDFVMDSDGDLLTDEEEVTVGTNRFTWDTDGDNLTDYWEIYDYPTSPLLADTDDDGLNDWEEVTFLGLTDPDEDGLQNPVDWDSDGDWIIDGLDAHPVLYDDTDGTVLYWDAIKVRNDVEFGVSVVMYGGSCNAKPVVNPATPPAPLSGGIGVFSSIQSACTPPFNSQIRMRYDDGSLPGSVEEEWLRMYYWSTVESKWKWIGTSGVDTTHDFVWAKVTEFSIFGIADVGLDDADGDGLSNKNELSTLYNVRFDHATVSFNIYSKGSPLFIGNNRVQYQIPGSKIMSNPFGSYGTVDLFWLGFVPSDFAVENTWKLTSDGYFSYISLSTSAVSDAQSAFLSFQLYGLMKYMRIDVSGFTDPFDPDTDNDGFWDGAEVEKYRTNPIDPDTDNDDVNDGADMDPLMDLQVTVRINEILQIDEVDSSFLYQDGADFYVKVFIEDEWYTSAKPGEWSNNPHVYPGWEFTRNVPDHVQNVEIKIQLWDQDWGSADDQLDISRGGETLDLTYNLRTGMWGGEDATTDGVQGRSGYGHASGREDGSHGYDHNDQEIWFDIYQSDYDGDRVAYWAEVDPDPVKIQRRADGSWYGGGALYVKNNMAQYRIPSAEIKISGNKYYGTVDLFELGFNKDDFKTPNTWQITNGGWRTYISLSTSEFDNVESASLYFEVTKYQSEHYMSIDVSYFTDPKAYDGDSDSDGMPDWWELRFGFNRYDASDANSDPDGDNLPNVEEYNWETDPRFFEVNLVVNLNFDASSAYINKFVKGVKLASDYIFDVTDGYLYFRTVFIKDQTNTTTADIVVEPGVAASGDYHWPNAIVGGIDSSGYQIILPEKFDSSGLGWGILAVNPDNGGYYRTMAHEFGHYGLYLYDEYEDADGKSYPCILGIACGPASLMNRANENDELTTPTQYAAWWKPWGYGMPEHWVFTGNKSCWETFFDKYKAKLWLDLDHNGVRDTSFLSSYTAYGGPYVGGPWKTVPGGFTKVEWVDNS